MIGRDALQVAGPEIGRSGGWLPFSLLPVSSLGLSSPHDVRGQPQGHAFPDGPRVGDTVLANYRGQGRWFPGRITDVRVVGGASHFVVLYHDGEVEQGVPLSDVRRAGTEPATPAVGPSLPSAFEEGKHGGNPGDLASRRSFSRPSLSLGAMDGGPVPIGPPSHGGPVPRTGDAVDANFRSLGVWHPGVVVRESLNPDGGLLVDVQYDDGDLELGVPVRDVVVRQVQGSAARTR
jgi:hypothetical protein